MGKGPPVKKGPKKNKAKTKRSKAEKREKRATVSKAKFEIREQRRLRKVAKAALKAHQQAEKVAAGGQVARPKLLCAFEVSASKSFACSLRGGSRPHCAIIAPLARAGLTTTVTCCRASAGCSHTGSDCSQEEEATSHAGRLRQEAGTACSTCQLACRRAGSLVIQGVWGVHQGICSGDWCHIRCLCRFLLVHIDWGLCYEWGGNSLSLLHTACRRLNAHTPQEGQPGGQAHSH